MAISKEQVDQLMSTDDGRAVILAAHYQNQARMVAECTGRTAEEVLAIVETLVVYGLIDEPSVALDELVGLVRGTRRDVRFDLLRDKLVLQLIKIDKLNIDRASELLATQRGQGEEENGSKVNT